jgi:lipid A 4'-phosphatase
MGIMTAAEYRADFQGQDANSNASLLIWGALIVGIIAGIIFYVFPRLDLEASALFYRGAGIFAGKGGGIFSGPPKTASDVIRLAFYISFVGIGLLNVLGLAVSTIRKRDVFGIGAVKWLFLGVCLLIGPGLFSNVILKDHWGRARPVHLVEFGGTKTYSPPLVPSNQCRKNCSFVAGEASMMYAAFFAAAFLFPAYGRRLIVAGILIGFFSGVIRMSQGAHFLSDVVFAGVAMALTVGCVFLIFRRVCRTGTPTDETTEQNPLPRRGL